MRSRLTYETLGILAGLAPVVILVIIVALLGMGMDAIGDALLPRVPIP